MIGHFKASILIFLLTNFEKNNCFGSAGLEFGVLSFLNEKGYYTKIPLASGDPARMGIHGLAKATNTDASAYKPLFTDEWRVYCYFVATREVNFMDVQKIKPNTVVYFGPHRYSPSDTKGHSLQAYCYNEEFGYIDPLRPTKIKEIDHRKVLSSGLIMVGPGQLGFLKHDNHFAGLPNEYSVLSGFISGPERSLVEHVRACVWGKNDKWRKFEPQDWSRAKTAFVSSVYRASQKFDHPSAKELPDTVQLRFRRAQLAQAKEREASIRAAAEEEARQREASTRALIRREAEEEARRRKASIGERQRQAGPTVSALSAAHIYLPVTSGATKFRGDHTDAFKKWVYDNQPRGWNHTDKLPELESQYALKTGNNARMP